MSDATAKTDLQISYVRDQMLPEQAAPAVNRGPIGWMREKLFPSIPQTILTLVCIYVLYLIIPPIIQFFLIDAVWFGEDRAACTTEAQGGVQPPDWFGACWAYVGDYANQFIYGRYPDESAGRRPAAGLVRRLLGLCRRLRQPVHLRPLPR